MRGLRIPERTQAFLARFAPFRPHFALKRHQLRASLYREQLTARFEARHLLPGVTKNPFTLSERLTLRFGLNPMPSS